MLNKEYASIVLGETMLNIMSQSKGDELDKRFKKLIQEAEDLNRDFTYYDSDPVRWCKKFMGLGEYKWSPQELADLRAITRYKGTISLWARQQKKTTNLKFAAAYEAISLKKNVLIVVPTDMLKSIMIRGLDFGFYPELKGLVVKDVCSGGCHIELRNGAHIWVHAVRTLKEGMACIREADVIYVDELDMIPVAEQDTLIELVGERQSFRFFATPVVRTLNGKQVFTPFQKLIETGASKTGNIKGFHTMHRMASGDTINSGILAQLPRSTIMTEFEANYNLSDASILLGE